MHPIWVWIFLFITVFPSSVFSMEVFRPSSIKEDDESVFSLNTKEPFQIILDGNTWVYQGKSDSIQFITETILPQEVRFNFLPNDKFISRVPLKFFSQDTTTGEISLLTVFVEPVFSSGETLKGVKEEESEKEFILSGVEVLINWADNSSWKNLSSEALQIGAERLAHWGDFQGAIILTKELERRGKKVSRLLGDFYYQSGDNKQAYASYQKALIESPEQNLIILTVFLGMLEKDTSTVTDFLRYWITSFPPPGEKLYLVILRYLIEQEQWSSAVRWANLYSKFYSFCQFEDCYYFLMGKVMEGESSYRNLRLALDFYNKVLKEYPLSIYWKMSYDRYLVLKGFYFSE